MTPVVYLSDAFLATGSEPWRIPDVADLPDIAVAQPHRQGRRSSPTTAIPTTLARPWAVPGTPGPGAPHRRPREGRHHRQRQLRPGQPPPDAAAARREDRRHRQRHPRRSQVYRPGEGRRCSCSAGARTYGAIRSAVERLQAEGQQRRPRPPAPPQPVPAQHRRRAAQLRQVLIPEVNLGQLLHADPGALPVDAVGLQPGPRQALPHQRDREAAERSSREAVTR